MKLLSYLIGIIIFTSTTSKLLNISNEVLPQIITLIGNKFNFLQTKYLITAGLKDIKLANQILQSIDNYRDNRAIKDGFYAKHKAEFDKIREILNRYITKNILAEYKNQLNSIIESLKKESFTYTKSLYFVNTLYLQINSLYAKVDFVDVNKNFFVLKKNNLNYNVKQNVVNNDKFHAKETKENNHVSLNNQLPSKLKNIYYN